MSSFNHYPKLISSRIGLNRVRSNHNLETTCEDVWKEEAKAIDTLQKKMKRADDTITKVPAPFKARSVDILQLVQIQQAHQTKQAAKSVWPGAGNREEPDKPTAGSQWRKICMQMADIIRRTGTGLERGIRWKSGVAPGMKDPAEVSLLTGNSVNAELAAGQRVKAVRTKLNSQTTILTASHPVYKPSE